MARRAANSRPRGVRCSQRRGQLAPSPATTLVINFEPDIRTNFLAWLTGAPMRVGYWTGGGGAFLTERGWPTTRASTWPGMRDDLSQTSPGAAIPASPSTGPRLRGATRRARRRVGAVDRPRRPWIGIHPSGGRQSKQWHLDRFALGRATTRRAKPAASIVADRRASRRRAGRRRRAGLGDVPHRVCRRRDVDLPDAGALCSPRSICSSRATRARCTSPARWDTPVVALFGPSDPARYGPRAIRERILRVDLPCSPCGQVRLPPVRCRGHVPDCMDGITVDAVVARRDGAARRRPATGRPERARPDADVDHAASAPGGGTRRIRDR